MARRAVPLLLALAAGFGASELLRARDGGAALEQLGRIEARLDALAIRQGVPSPVELRPPAALDLGVLRAEIAAALAASQETSARCQRPAEAMAPEPDPASQAALQRGHAIVGAALQRGAWTDRDALAIRGELAAAGAGGEELIRQLATAVNEGQVRLETSGPPF